MGGVTATSYNNIGLVLEAKDDLDEALEHYRKGMVIQEATLGEHHSDAATAYNNIREVLREKGDLDGALPQWASSTLTPRLRRRTTTSDWCWRTRATSTRRWSTAAIALLSDRRCLA